MKGLIPCPVVLVLSGPGWPSLVSASSVLSRLFTKLLTEADRAAGKTPKKLQLTPLQQTKCSTAAV